MRPLRSSGVQRRQVAHPNARIRANLLLSPRFLLFSFPPFFVRALCGHVKDVLFGNGFFIPAVAARAIVYMTAPSKRKRSRGA